MIEIKFELQFSATIKLFQEDQHIIWRTFLLVQDEEEHYHKDIAKNIVLGIRQADVEAVDVGVNTIGDDTTGDDEGSRFQGASSINIISRNYF